MQFGEINFIIILKISMEIKFIPYKSLFIHSYNLAKLSKANREEPFHSVVFIILLCAIFNIHALLMLISSIEEYSFLNDGVYKLVFTVIYLLFIFLIYYQNKRYKKIIKEDYQNKKINLYKSITIVVLYYILSFIILLLVGLFKNKDWIFSN